MAGGLIGTGTGYRNSALSGFVRESALDEKIREANEELQTAYDVQGKRTGAQIAGIGATVAASYAPKLWAGTTAPTTSSELFGSAGTVGGTETAAGFGAGAVVAETTFSEAIGAILEEFAPYLAAVAF